MQLRRKPPINPPRVEPGTELDVRRTLEHQRACNADDGNHGTVFVPKWTTERYPGIALAVEEIDWLQIEPEGDFNDENLP